MRAVQVLQNDSDWYIIPNDLIVEFSDLSNLIYECEQESDEWYEAIEEFEAQFAHYATGGDINNIKLYADI